MHKIFVFCLYFTYTTIWGQQKPEMWQFYLQQEAQRIEHNPLDYTDFVVSSQHVSSTSGVNHIYVTQRYDGIEIELANMSLHLGQDQQLLVMHNKFIDDIATKINTTSPVIMADQAISMVASQLGYNDLRSIELLDHKGGKDQKQIWRSNELSLSDIPIKLKYQSTLDGDLRLCWDMSIQEVKSPDWWSIRIDAVTGIILDKVNWTVSCDFTTDKEGYIHGVNCNHIVKEETGVSAMVPNSYRVFPLGYESPSHGPSQLVVDPADTLASPYGWHDFDGVIGAEFTNSKGNNVEAKDDFDANNSGGMLVEGGVDLIFDYPLNPTLPPASNLNSALTNLFYWNNVMHDVWYHYGFDEAAGNFQENNYGNGGLGSDYVNADALDGGGTNNANFSTPVDGSNPRMQMYAWNTSFSVEVNSPSSVAGSYSGAIGGFGPGTFSVTADLILADPILACTSITNDLTGKIAVVDRGDCNFSVKCLNAQNAGAIAVIVCNTDNTTFTMGAGSAGSSVTIPSIMMRQDNCNTLKVQIPNTVNVTLSNIQKDSDFDNGIIAHEYGHGISTRLTGGAANSSCLNNQEQMGEGWSDWFGLMLTIKVGDIGSTGRGIGTYVLNQAPTGSGIRTHRYSTSLTINPHTYNSIIGLAAPHGVGSVWCAMLWEMTWLLIEEYGFDPDYYTGTGGNNIAMALVTEALKLQPCSPGFVDGRDAILLADQVLYGGANECLIWEAFAKRGLGYSASQGSAGSKTDGTEAFDLPPSCFLELKLAATPSAVIEGDQITYTVILKNTSTTSLTNIILTDTLSPMVVYQSSNPPAIVDGSNITFNTPSIASGDSMLYTIVSKVPLTQAGGRFQLVDSVEQVNDLWDVQSTNTNLSSWERTTSNPSSGAYSWFAPDNPVPNNHYLTLASPVRIRDTSVLTFSHAFDTEEDWDGGLVLISTNNGQTWEDLGPHFIQNGYNGILNNNVNSPGFSGNSNGYIQSVIDLGDYAGADVLIRFWMYCDAAVGGLGWFLDDIYIDNLQTTIPNEVSVINDQNFNTSTILKNPTPLSNCRLVTNESPLLDEGALRTAINCASVGDTIRFTELMSGNTIMLQNTLILDKNIHLKHVFPIPVAIHGLNVNTLEVANGVKASLTNMHIINASANTRALTNHGILQCYNISFMDQWLNTANHSTILNFGTLDIQSSSNLKD